MTRRYRWIGHSLLTAGALAATASTAPAAPATSGAAMPASMRDIVLAARAHPVVETELDGVRFRAIAPFSAVPYLLWPDAPASAASPDPVPHDRDAAARWLVRSARVLGLGDFDLRYRERFDWHGNEVWVYGLTYRGLAVHDARILVHWRDGRLVGIVNAVPQPIVRIDAPPRRAGRAIEHLYVGERVAGGYALVLATAKREAVGGRSELTLTAGGRPRRHIITPLPARTPPGGEAFAAGASLIREWPLPAGTFPDQIDTDSTGLVWFTQGLDNWLTSFDRATETFVHYPTTGADVPDAMVVDRNDVLWTGLYDGVSGMGKFDIATTTFSIHAAPYPSPSMAAPIETARGTIWITDHQANRISEYDPTADVWLQSLVMPTPTAWVVHGIEDTATQDVYFTEYIVDQLARKGLTGPIAEIPTPAGGGPAFGAYHDGKIYISQGSYDRLAVYDIATGNIDEFTYPVANEPGGPIDATPDGLIAVGTRNLGYIMVFNPALGSFASHLIPTGGAFLKDGLRSDVSGAVWFTESGADRIAVLDRCAPPGPDPLGGQALFAVKEGAGARLAWIDEPTAEGFRAASSETRDFAAPLTAFAMVGSGNPGVADTSPLGPTGLRCYRVAAARCGMLSSY